MEDWSVVSLIGQGSFGHVYKVERTVTGVPEQAALKVISFDKTAYASSEDPAEKEAAETYLQDYIQKMINNTTAEVQIVSELSGSCINIIQYRDYQIVEDESKVKLMLLMDLLIPLTKHFQGGIIKEKTIIQLGIDICNALIHLERHAIIHGDVKPNNIFVDNEGNYILGDFGGATKDTEHSLMHIGTLNYAAPEVFTGGSYTHGVDIYGLGMVLFRFLNYGNLPFLNSRKHETPYLIERARKRRLSGELPTLALANQVLAACVIKAIHPDLEKRYHSAEEFRNDLELAYRHSKDIEYIQGNVALDIMNSMSLKSVEDALIQHPQKHDLDSLFPNIPTLICQTEHSSSFTLLIEPPRSNSALSSQNSIIELSQLSDVDLAHISETTVILLSDRAYHGNPVAKKQLLHINQVINFHLPSTPAEEYSKMLLKACQLLIENSSYSRNTSENEMNDYIRDILIAQGNIVQDQTRQGRSSMGKGAGEIDIKATYGDYEPALIEALKTDSLKSKVLKNHIKKLMVNYDPIGVYCHFLLIYYWGRSFSDFTHKIITWLKTNRITQLSFNDVSYQRYFTNLSGIRVTCIRDAHHEEFVIFVLGISN